MRTEQHYDAIPYESFAIKQTHPHHLFTLATLYGLAPPPPQHANILELGCASGGNLIPMAAHMPNARFVGIDLSLNQINAGLKQIQDLRLKNIILRGQSILDFNEPQTKFDYIICHGVYSWVAQEVKEKILAICKQNLSKNGVAYISYNTYPGWHIADIAREMLLYATQHIVDPLDKAAAVHAFLNFIFEGVREDPSLYADLMRKELNLLAQHSDSYLVHEHLSDYNTPVYFYQFMNQAQKYNLRFVSEAFLSNMSFESEDPNDPITMGQILDIQHNQRFRCSLLCHDDIQPSLFINKELLTSFYLQNKAYQDFSSQNQLELLKNVFTGKVQISAFKGDYITELSGKPLACPLARYQIQFQPVVTNRRHENIELDTFGQIILPYLDGTHDIAALVNIIEAHIDNGDIVLVDEEGKKIYNKQEISQRIQFICKTTLKSMAKQALLISSL